jgi:hypothetical protein
MKSKRLHSRTCRLLGDLRPETGGRYAAKRPLKIGERKRTLRVIERRTRIMKLALIVLGLLATTGVVYAACIFC